MDVAASIQAVTEEVVLRLTRTLAREYGIRNLCLAGGVALNCVANGKILRDGAFDRIWIQPAAGDAGGAIGAALAAWHLEFGQPRAIAAGGDGMKGAYLGPLYAQADIDRRLSASGAVFDKVSDRELIDITARALADGKAVGWFQGRMEFGPRALGARSILGDPRSPTMQKMLNLKVKYRESFRPFAPAVMREDVADWFELERDSPYMLLVADVKRDHAPRNERRRARAFRHRQAERGALENSGGHARRLFRAHPDRARRYQRALSRAARPASRTSPAVRYLVNTSFNVRGEPIVCTPEDAFRCFLGTDLDLLVCGNAMMPRRSKPPTGRPTSMSTNWTSRRPARAERTGVKSLYGFTQPSDFTRALPFIAAIAMLLLIVAAGAGEADLGKVNWGTYRSTYFIYLAVRLPLLAALLSFAPRLAWSLIALAFTRPLARLRHECANAHEVHCLQSIMPADTLSPSSTSFIRFCKACRTQISSAICRSDSAQQPRSAWTRTRHRAPETADRHRGDRRIDDVRPWRRRGSNMAGKARTPARHPIRRA